MAHITPEAALQELKRRRGADPLNYPASGMWPSHNPAQVRAIQAVSRGDPINILTFGNGTGKTHALISMWSAIMFGTRNPLFAGGIFGQWPRKWPKNVRLCAPESLLGDRDVIQLLMAKLFPKGRWQQQKNHKNIYSTGQTDNGWTWDIMTYDQAALQAAGETKGLMLYSEPPPRPLWDENLARLRAGGMIIAEMTPMNMSPWILDDYIDLGVLKNDKGVVIGRINHIRGDIWDNCDESPGGQLPREAIELILSQYSPEEREMREKGTFGRLQGRIYKIYDPKIYEIEKMELYHQECFTAGKFTLYNVVDPHDRKPFAIGWYAVFPNDDILVLAEFPDSGFDLFHKITSFTWTPEEYAATIKATEDGLLKPLTAAGLSRPKIVRWIDPNFGQTTQFATKMSIRQTFYKWGQDPAHTYDLNYGLPADSIADGHLAVKEYLGDVSKNIRPKIYVLKHCRNHAYGFTHYAYKENRDNLTKGVSEAPQLVYKDFMDLVRYLCIMKPTYIPPVDPNAARPVFYRRASYPGRS